MLRRLACFFLVLAGSVHSYTVQAATKSDYEIINTGIKGGGCWLDDSHFIVVKGQQPAPGQEFEVEGVYYLDPNKPKDLRRIELSPIESAIQRQIRDVSCQDGTILFYMMAPDRKTSRLYSVKIGAQPELIADMRWARPSAISLKGQYILGNKLTVDKGVWEEHSDCSVRFLKPGLKALCWPRRTLGQWLTSQFVLSKYVWDSTVKTRNQDGTYRWIPNPEAALKRADGTEVNLGFLLRDLDNRLVQEIPIRQGTYQYDTVNFKSDPKGQYLYCPCWKAGDHGDQHYTVGGRVCRFQLDGENQNWEEVVSVQQSPEAPFSLHDLDVNAQGDVVMIERGHRGFVSLWKYTAQSKVVEKLLQVASPEDLGPPLVSPNGRWVSVKRQSQLVLIESKGVMP